MPKVGKMRFPYTKKGMEDATNYAKNARKPIEVEGYRGGGRVPKYQYGGAVPSRPMMRPQGRRPIGRPMPRLRPPVGPGRGRGLFGGAMGTTVGGRNVRYKNGGKVPALTAVAERLSNLIGYA